MHFQSTGIAAGMEAIALAAAVAAAKLQAYSPVQPPLLSKYESQNPGPCSMQ